jgi:hypothetical protein
MRKNQEIKPIKITRDYPENFWENPPKIISDFAGKRTRVAGKTSLTTGKIAGIHTSKPPENTHGEPGFLSGSAVTGLQVLGCGSHRLHGSWVFGDSAGETPIPPENAPDIATEGRLHGFSVTGSWLGGFGVTVSSETATGPPDFPLTTGHGGSVLPGLTAHWILSGFSLSLSSHSPLPISRSHLSVSLESLFLYFSALSISRWVYFSMK